MITTHVWILVFMYQGIAMTSGPYGPETCQLLAKYHQGSHCWNPQTKERRPWPLKT